MKVQLVGSTNNITDIQEAKRYVQNHARICYSEKSWDELLEESFQQGLVKSLITRGHHSPIDHFNLNFYFDGPEKALAMVFNNQGVYTTSEKSARYTKMSDIPEHQLFLYNKWNGLFNNELSFRFPQNDFPKLHKKGSDGKTNAEKLSQENARYMTSVFTPTKMTHTLSWRQLNILYNSFNEFIDFNSQSKFKRELSKGMQSFVDSPEVQKWIIREAQFKMKGGIPLRFIRETPVEEHFGEDIYSTNYKASFASLAQLHRHRLAIYDICGGFGEGAENGFYIPRLVEASGTGKIKEWVNDLERVANYDFPQAQLINVGERGMREHIPAKSIERECGLAQLETARVHSNLLTNYSKVIPAMGKYNNPACVVEGNCKKGGCNFGAEMYLERLI
jgi:hypothetical protein